MQDLRNYKDGFIVLKPIPNRRLLVYMDARDISLYDKERSEYVDFYHQEKLTGLSFENQVYYQHEDLEVLKDYPFIEHLIVGQINIKDLSGIKYVDSLKSLAIDGNTTAFDFDLVKNSLESAGFTWRRNLSNIHVLKKLKSLTITRDNEGVQLPPNIEYLDLWRSKRTNLDFLVNHSFLKEIRLNSNRKLDNINGLIHLNDSLEKLEIDGCKKITDYMPILELKKLKYLSIESYDKIMKESLKALKSNLRDDIEGFISPNVG